MAAPDVLIVGGGVIGMLTARELDQEGVQVEVIERQHTGRESTWAGGGILSPLHPWRYPDPVNDLARWSQPGYPQLASDLHQATGINPEWIQNGMLIAQVKDHETALGWAKRFGYFLAKVDPEEACRLEPKLAAPSGLSIWLDYVAQVRNPRLAQSLRRDLELRGVPLHENVEVKALSHERQQITGVATKASPLSAGQVIIAAGAWTGELLKDLNPSVSIEPVRGQMLVFRAEPGIVTRILLSEETYLIPRRDGRILAGSTQERVGFDKQPTQEAFEDLRQRAQALVPVLAEYPIEHHWAGLRPGSPNGVPYIGPHPALQGLWINAGHFRNGLVTAPASARLLADLILGRPPILRPENYAITTPRG